MDKKSTTKDGGKKLSGVVVSDKMNKTAVVLIKSFVKHKKYGKFINLSKRIKAHNDGLAKEGDKVSIQECRPISKDKNFKIVSVLK
jgi:small subunit ribosomal protein S17